MGAIYGKGVYGDRLYSRASDIAEISGDLTVEVEMSEIDIDVFFSLEGDLNPSIEFAVADMFAGPLFEDDELCPPSEWEPAPICPPPTWVEDKPLEPAWAASASAAPVTWKRAEPAEEPWVASEVCSG